MKIYFLIQIPQSTRTQQKIRKILNPISLEPVSGVVGQQTAISGFIGYLAGIEVASEEEAGRKIKALFYQLLKVQWIGSLTVIEKR